MEQQVVDLVSQHKWFALAAMAIWAIVRLLKHDGPIPINIPAKYRAPLALGLGVIAGVIDKIASGTPWRTALVGGLFAGFAAISGHDIVTHSLRGGREVGESKENFVKRSMRPPPMPPGADPGLEGEPGPDPVKQKDQG